MEVACDLEANGPRLRLADRESGAVVWLDAFVLRTLCLLPPEALRGLCRATVPQDEVPAPGGRTAP